MCGIVAYVGPKPAADVVLGGLRHLEYRGYDSAGIAEVADGAVQMRRKAGALSVLEELLGADPLPQGHTALGHTRWATHGAPTDENAHPHLDCHGNLALIHNGIIENHVALRSRLLRAGHVFRSQTDSEVAAHLLEEAFAQSGDLAEALRVVCHTLEGSFSLVALHRDAPGQIVGARRNSPLVVGFGDGGMFLGSDVAAFIAHTRDAIELGQDQVVSVTANGVTITTFAGEVVNGRHFHVDWDVSAAERGGYSSFMLKEIAEQPAAVAATLLGRLTDDGALMLDEMRLDESLLRDIDKIVVVACGTAYHAGLIAKYVIEHWAGLPCEVELASEFRYRDPILDSKSLVIAISQSGETLDTLMAVQHAHEMGARVLAICNTVGSTIPRESDAVLYTRAGLEIGVAATKTFLTQLVAVDLVALYLGQVRGVQYGDEITAIVAQLAQLPAHVAHVLTTMEPVRAIARALADVQTVLFLGRHVGYPVALEGALKLQELAYMHAEGFAAGELKHGPIALIEDGLPVVVITPSPVSDPLLHSKLLSNIREIQARGARTIVVAEEGDDTVAPFADFLVELPRVPKLFQPLVATVPLQILAAEIARSRGYDIDKPRNLAKSVTVE